MHRGIFGSYAASKEVTTPAEYKEAVAAAELLGLELVKVSAYGYGWEAADDQPVHPDAGGSGVEIRKVGRKYFHMALSGPDGTEVVPVKCGRAGSSTLDDAKLILRFSKA